MEKIKLKMQIDNEDNKNSISKLIKSSILIGIITGIIISINRILISNLFNVFKNLYLSGRENINNIFFIFTILVILGIFIGKQINKNSMISGSGVPQVESILENKTKVNWISIILNKFLTLTICSGSGLSHLPCHHLLHN